MYIVANNKTKVVLEESGIYKGVEPSDTIIVAIHNTDPTWSVDDYSVFRYTDLDIYEKIKRQGYTYELTWSGLTIAGFNFDIPSAKKIIDIQFDKDIINYNTAEYITLTLKMYMPDGITLDTSFNGDVTLKVISPYERYEIEAASSPEVQKEYDIVFTFINGVCKYKFYGYTIGEWVIPRYTMISYRLKDDFYAEVVQ